MSKYKFSVSGKVIGSRKAKASGDIRTFMASFQKTVYADDFEEAVWIASDKLRKKYCADNKLYEVVDFNILKIDVYQLIHEHYDWSAHHKYGLQTDAKYKVV